MHATAAAAAIRSHPPHLLRVGAGDGLLGGVLGLGLRAAAASGGDALGVHGAWREGAGEDRRWRYGPRSTFLYAAWVGGGGFQLTAAHADRHAAPLDGRRGPRGGDHDTAIHPDCWVWCGTGLLPAVGGPGRCCNRAPLAGRRDPYIA